MKGNLFMKSVLAFGIMQASAAHAGAFHTIIGPDGRPMVVQMPDRNVSIKEAKKKTESQVLNTEISEPAAVPKAAQLSVPINPAQEQKLQQVIHGLETKPSSKSTLQSAVQPPIQVNKLVEENQPDTLTSKDLPAVSAKEKTIDVVKPAIQPVAKQALKIAPKSNEALSTSETKSAAVKNTADSLTKTSPVQVPAAVMRSIQNNEALNMAQSPFKALPPELLKKPAATAVQPAEPQTGFSAMNGEQYVNSEYLEDKEFNLEGKKRFYAMPEGVIDNKIGATRMQMVEREKGVSKSIIESLFKRSQPAEKGPVALSASYYRVSEADAVSGLGQQCFKEKQFKNAKSLKPLSEMNLWPRAPLKDEFDFEVIKLENAIQNIQINSYASKQNNPTFYWPFVVFLDTQGCVLEGAGGYKNKDGNEDHLRRERIEGVIQVPDKTQYILMTPLATAIDVRQRELTNHGQLKLIAIR